MNRRTFLKSSVTLAAVPWAASWSHADSAGEKSRWVRPIDGSTSPLWGHADGLQVGLHPLRGPRGLLRVYAPYLGNPPEQMINYIAVEPIVAGQPQRGLSELEPSKLDGVRGKRFWSENDAATDPTPRPTDQPAPGIVETIDGVESLLVFVGVEHFDSGAHVYVRLTFRADRPREVGVAAFAQEDSAPLSHCVLTATMGNYARLRRLHLANDRIVTSQELWPNYRDNGFTPHAKFTLAEMTRTPEGHAAISATPDEANPQNAEYSFGTRRHWRYEGKVARQTWRSENPSPSLEAWVNGRFTYWASRNPIPGGVSFENFELFTPFRQGEEFWFNVEPITPDSKTAKPPK